MRVELFSGSKAAFRRNVLPQTTIWPASWACRTYAWTRAPGDWAKNFWWNSCFRFIQFQKVPSCPRQ